MKHTRLCIGDIAVALELALHPEAHLKYLADRTRRSLGEIHNAEKRLRAARLLRPGGRAVERGALLQFIRWGVTYAFPATTGAVTRGVATAQLTSAPQAVPEELATLATLATPKEPAESEFVWPFAEGVTRGQAFVPPYPKAPALAVSNPGLRALLNLLDLVRVGGAREQAAAVDEIEYRISEGN